MRRSKREAARETAEALRQQKASWSAKKKADQAIREQKITEALQVSRGPKQVVERILSSAHDPLLNRLRLQLRGSHFEVTEKFRALLQYIGQETPRLLDPDYIGALYFVSRVDWLRPLPEWTTKGKGRESMFRSLASHLLAKYPMPNILWGAFFENSVPKIAPVVSRVAAGGSLFKEVQEGALPVPLTRKMCHEFLSLPGEKFVEGIRTVQIRANQGDRTLLRAWMGTTVGAEINRKEEELFWATVLLWFCQNPMLDRHQTVPILDFITHRRREEPDFSMKGRSPLAFLRAVDEWHGDLARTKAITGKEYAPSGFKGGHFITKDRNGLEYHWHVAEILTDKLLAAEGSAMRHCVYSYAFNIERGMTSIWSITCSGERKATIEVRNQARSVVQARGKCNAALGSHESKVLLKWAQNNGLTLTTAW